MWCMWAMSVAAAQVTGGEIPELNAQTFRPTIDGQGLLWADDAGRRRGQPAQGRLLLQYVDDPLVYVSATDEVRGLVTSLLQLDLLGGVNLGPLRIGAHVPVYLRTAGDDVPVESGLGDIAGDAKLTVVDGPRAPLDLGAGLRVWAPTATVDTALGNPNLAWELTGLISRELGPVLLAANVGTRGGPPAELENIELNDAFIGRLAVGLRLSERLGLAAEGSTLLPYTEPFTNPAASPLEVLGSGWFYPSRQGNLVLRAGAGGGVTPGIGAPDFRVILGLAIEPRGVDPDDQCPDEAEDYDEFEDEDGCPDLDNDKDGILDVDDACPNDPEDLDEYQDGDGCPERTMVRVHVIDAGTEEPVDTARIVVKDDEGHGTSSLNPYVMPNDEGAYTVAVSAIGYVAEDVELVVEEGPPIDLVVPLSPESDAPARMTRDKIELRDTINFRTNSAEILPESYPVLDAAVKIVEDYPEILKLRIEGHTDERGSDSYNLALSQRRAASVRKYFIGTGVDARRLVSEGYGEEQPIDDRSTPEAWAKNRRVDFFILEFDIEAWQQRVDGAE